MKGWVSWVDMGGSFFFGLLVIHVSAFSYRQQEVGILLLH